MIQIRKEDNREKAERKETESLQSQYPQKNRNCPVGALAMSFLFAVYKNFTAIDIHTVHETKVIKETILDTDKIENFVENFAEVDDSWKQSAASIDSRK